ncbi:2TM domain-containing protein [Winogradskyella immobilis]|uniref:2TM domain-containing protein n=1 Tax=Winogradskyella immobilis TaxID=2816852 RepID=A0ABS8ENU7_9FLAO|nr:2TM domain-containing protein [Winogradskyella immobilis]MCC1484863.1 2TM domain-containing protein [Winogradskyella immobilis]MCG0016955.1 2TM domain-containing protein [Winogradskyella immobilis]
MKKYNIEPYNDHTDEKRYYKEEAYIRAKKKLDKLKGFYWHLVSYVIVNIFLIIVIGSNSGEGYFSFASFSTAIFWGIGLFFHFLGVFGPDFLFGKNWEERKVKEYMDKEEKRWE